VTRPARNNGYYYRQWLHLRLRKWLVHPLCRRIYQDRNTDLGKSMIVAGTGRSGTTWLAKIISSQLSCRVMFEPFHARYVPDFRGFEYFQYMRPEAEDGRLEAYCHQVLSGRIRHPWIDREVEVVFPRYRLIKEIRMNLFLKWLAQRVPQVPVLFIIRHPCAVVQSRMQLGWATDDDLAPFLVQDALVADFLTDKMDIIRRAESPEQKHAVVWCISNLVPLRQFTGTEWHVFFYENLVLQPEAEIPRMFAAIRQDFSPSVFATLGRPSSSTTSQGVAMFTSKGIADWKNSMTVRQIDEVLGVVAAFGLDSLYDDSGAPGTSNRFASTSLRARIDS
jgi:hypothetical protein